MPLGDEKHNLIYQELVNILGPEHISDGPVTLRAYSRSTFAAATLNRNRRAEFIALPENTEDIQKIVQLANRYKFPFSIMGSGVMMPLHGAARPYWCLIDPKRMTRIEIDDQNMYAIIEPGVTHAQVQAEAMKLGLFNGIPLVGAQACALANHVWHGQHGTAYRTGFATRNLLGMEWILPNGEILKTGSLTGPKAEYFWGEGPGPDFRNVRKGYEGENGAFGIITRIAIKLHPWPGPPFLPTSDIRPCKRSELPPEFKWYLINYRTEKECCDAMYAFGKAEIGGVMQKWGGQILALEQAKSREEYWTLLEDGYWEKHCKNLVAVCLWPFASEKQVQYEEKVLKQIVDETGGQLVPDEVYERVVPYVANTLIRNEYGCRWIRFGSVHTPLLAADTLDGIFDMIAEHWAHVSEYTPPILEMPGQSAWVLPFDFCHSTGAGVDVIHEKIDETCQGLMKETREGLGHDMTEGICCQNTNIAPAEIVGPSFSNYHIPLYKIKKSIDPNNVANPGRFINVEKMERAEKEKEKAKN